MNEVREYVKGRLRVELEVGGSPMIMVESGKVGFVGQEYLPTLSVLDKMIPVVVQMWIVVDHAVFDSQPEGC